MTTVILDESTADQLQTRAAVNGMSVDAYVKLLLGGAATDAPARLSWHEVESLLDEHAHDGPTLPADFSRADIYGEHD